MATGDMKNNLKKLQAGLKSIKYEKDVDINSLSKGVPAAFLPIYHHAFIDFSRPIAEKIAEKNIELYGKSDLRFIEGMYKVLRELFAYKPELTKDQFFSNGFAEKKVIMCTSILKQVHSLHIKLGPKPRPKTAPTGMTSIASASIVTVNNHKKADVTELDRKVPVDAAKQTVRVIANASADNTTLTLSTSVSSNVNPAPLPVVQVTKEIGPPNSIHQSAPISHAVQLNRLEAFHPPVSVVSAKPEGYNPSAYAAVEESPRDSPPLGDGETVPASVEIVCMNSDSDSFDDMRPINRIPKTPGKPLVEAHARESAVSDKQQNLFIVVEHKLTTVTKTMNRLMDRLTSLEDKMSLLEKQTHREPLVDNIMARLTLLENNYQLLKAQHNNGVTSWNQPELDSLELNVVHNESPIAAQYRVKTVQSFHDDRLPPAMTSTPVVTSSVATANKDSVAESMPQSDRIKNMLMETQKMLKIADS